MLRAIAAEEAQASKTLKKIQDKKNLKVANNIRMT